MTKTNIAHHYAKQFGKEHPEAGSLSEGKLDHQALGEFAQIIHGRALEINHKALEGAVASEDATSRAERAFVARSADMLTRTIYTTTVEKPYLLANPVVGAGIKEILKHAGNSGYEFPDEKKQIKKVFEGRDDPASVGYALEASRTIVESLGVVEHEDKFRVHSSNLTDMIGSSFNVLSEIARQEDGLVITPYTKGNLEEIMAKYEVVERQQQPQMQAVA